MTLSNRATRFGLRLLDGAALILREHSESLLLVFALALMVRWFVLSAFVLRSDVMAPSLLAGDVVLAYRPPFGLALPIVGTVVRGRPPERGELVVLRCPGADGTCLLRVVAVGGDRIEMIKQRLSINGTMCEYSNQGEVGPAVDLTEKCGNSRRRIRVEKDWQAETWGPVIVPPGQVFLLNDNRISGGDSREGGPVAASTLEAKVFAVLLSFDWGASNSGPLVRWSRSFSAAN